jgi:hypothetical protein
VQFVDLGADCCDGETRAIVEDHAARRSHFRSVCANSWNAVTNAGYDFPVGLRWAKTTTPTNKTTLTIHVMVARTTRTIVGVFQDSVCS